MFYRKFHFRARHSRVKADNNLPENPVWLILNDLISRGMWQLPWAFIYMQIYTTLVLVRISTAMMKHHNWSNLGRKRAIWLTHPYRCSSVKEARTGILKGQETGDRSWSRGHGEVLSTGLFPMAYSACFVRKPGPPSQGWYHPQRAGPSLTNP